jgi:3-demethylubiquinone-9 3-methyltransferase
MLFITNIGALDLDKQKGVNMTMQTITPHLWFDKEAKEAAELYTSIFQNSRIKNSATLHNTPSGTVDILTIELQKQEFRLISAGRSSSSLRLYRFSLLATRKKKSMHCGMNSQKGLGSHGARRISVQ